MYVLYYDKAILQKEKQLVQAIYTLEISCVKIYTLAA